MRVRTFSTNVRVQAFQLPHFRREKFHTWACATADSCGPRMSPRVAAAKSAAADLIIGMVLWGAAGAIAFFILQNWGVWKWTLFTVPLGILAVIGVEVVVTMVPPGSQLRPSVSIAAGALVILTFIVGAPVPQVQTQLLWFVVVGVCAVIASEVVRGACARAPGVAERRGSHGCSLNRPGGHRASQQVSGAHASRVPALTARSRAEFQHFWNRAYQAADEDLAILRRTEVLPGPFYVFGDPILLLRANRPQAVAVPGWGPELLDSRAWRELDSTLRVALPPYIIVDRFSEPFVRSRSPGLMEWIESSYKVAFVGASGTWYLLFSARD